MFVEPMEPAGMELQWTCASAVVWAQRELRVALVPQRHPTVPLSRLQQRLVTLVELVARVPGWRAGWLTEDWWWPGAEDHGR